LQIIQEITQIVSQRRDKAHPSTAAGMIDFKFFRVQRLPRKNLHTPLVYFRGRWALAAVDFVSNQRMLQIRQMNPDLMGSPSPRFESYPG